MREAAREMAGLLQRESQASQATEALTTHLDNYRTYHDNLVEFAKTLMGRVTALEERCHQFGVRINAVTNTANEAVEILQVGWGEAAQRQGGRTRSSSTTCTGWQAGGGS